MQQVEQILIFDSRIEYSDRISFTKIENKFIPKIYYLQLFAKWKKKKVKVDAVIDSIVIPAWDSFIYIYNML